MLGMGIKLQLNGNTKPKQLRNDNQMSTCKQTILIMKLGMGNRKEKKEKRSTKNYGQNNI